MDKLEHNPPSRFPDRPIEQAATRWWIAKVKPRQEKALAFDFIGTGIEYYLPLYKRVYTRPGQLTRKRVFLLPLFPGYIAFSQDTPHDIFKTGRVVSILEIRNQQRFIIELSQIYQTLELGFSMIPLEGGIQLGSEVEIAAGPLLGVRGNVTEIRQERLLVLSVEGMGRALVKVDINDVQTL